MGSPDGGVLDFDKAMSDFRIMFPDMEKDVIEAVLRAHGGEVDATLDHLLAMSKSSEEKPLAKEVEVDLIQLGPSLDPREMILDPLQVEDKEERPQALAYSHPARPPEPKGAAVLPTPQMLQNRYEENLKNRERLRTSGEPALTQYLEDERVALMLQNEEFMAELRRDQEFISALESESQVSGSVREAPPQGASSLSSKMDEILFREKIKNMGKTSKKKFSQLASMFSRRKAIARTMLGNNSSAPSNDNLLGSEVLTNEVDSDDEGDRPVSRHSSVFRSSKGGKYSSFS
eukprot:TRINITY_DN2144_c0_g1_i1.p1 TRINITY_DN2144_c0_g1~~TRINITY_DN2144_c0_g1_i1.p1  ORF type:complete len:289 (-),score=119.25 TRINITY_DN2144_c0_g1_i1:838-1704(-)